MPGQTGFRLDDEQRKEVRDRLKKAGVGLVEPFNDFIGRIESSIDHFRTTKPKGTFREAHDGLREIWLLSQEDDPSPALLRVRLRSLPPLALEFLARRARAVFPRLFPGEELEGDVFEPPTCFVARFLGWVERADGAPLVIALRALSADGGRWVPGRSRGDGRRSAAQLEPQVLGVVHGSVEPKPEGGRPSKDASQQLVMHLAIDWLHATGKAPESGRSDRKGFGNRVHSIFGSLYVPKSGTQETIDAAIEAAIHSANYALRRYWAEVKRGKARSSLSAKPSRFCVDCRWMLRLSGDLDHFFCRRLNIACSTAREALQGCGPEGKLFETPG